MAVDNNTTKRKIQLKLKIFYSISPHKITIVQMVDW